MEPRKPDSAIPEKIKAFLFRKLTLWQRARSLLKNVAAFDVINIGCADLMPTEISGIKYRDITPEINQVIAMRNIQDGIVNIQPKHTTTGLVLLLQEHEDGLAKRDIVQHYIAHKLRPEWNRLQLQTFEHDREERIAALGGHEPRNGTSHLLACQGDVCKPSLTLNVHGGSFDRGTWQSILLFVDFDSGPHHPGRQISIVVQRLLP